jgi:hypothetical protein
MEIIHVRHFVFVFSALIVLAPRLALAQTQPSRTPASRTGIEGTISASPAQGGPSKEGGSHSRPLANMAFEVKQGDRVVSSFQTDAQGHFRVLLEPGHYTISRKDYTTAVGFYGPFEVEVSRGKMATVQWECDTGLR